MDVLWSILFLILLVFLVAALPVWPHSRRRGWGYTASAVAAVLLVTLLLLVWLGRVALWWPLAAAA